MPNNLELKKRLHKITREILFFHPYSFFQHYFKPRWNQDNICNIMNIITNSLRRNLSNQERTKSSKANSKKSNLTSHQFCMVRWKKCEKEWLKDDMRKVEEQQNLRIQLQPSTSTPPQKHYKLISVMKN